MDLVGCSVSFSDEDITQTNRKFWVGIFKDGATDADSGLKIVDPSGTTTEFTDFNPIDDTFYYMVISISYNYFDGTYSPKINVWIDGTRYITDFSINRSYLYGKQIDGSYGLIVDQPLASSPAPVKKDEYALSNSDSSTNFDQSTDYHRQGQTFTAGSTYYLYQAKFNLDGSALGGSDGYVYAEIFATSGGAPTGDYLARSAGILANSIGASETTVTFTFGTPYQVQSGTTYCICVYWDGSSPGIRSWIGLLHTVNGSSAEN